MTHYKNTMEAQTDALVELIEKIQATHEEVGEQLAVCEMDEFSRWAIGAGLTDDEARELYRLARVVMCGLIVRGAI